MRKYEKIVFFTGAGMSAESGIHTYRGEGGIWDSYKWRDVACQKAFETDPRRVLDFHEKRRMEALEATPHNGHQIIKNLENELGQVDIITQNIDGMHQRADSKNVLELHGSLWRMRCDHDNLTINDLENYKYVKRMCKCGSWLRPDIVWFEDSLDHKIMNRAAAIISGCDLFVSIGTSGLVWPAAGYINLAKNSGALCVDINPEEGNFNSVFDVKIRDIASKGLDQLLKILRPN
tara:strand:+ start:845 stop:1546 length:702 start_codon:yes stop_codon:yes gene_type:complete